MKKLNRWIFRMSEEQNLFVGFAVYTLIGCFLLCMPFSQKAAIPILDSLFIATSAISTTGLVTVSIYDNYNMFGQFVIMLLIQIGGIGYMTFSSFLILSAGDGISRTRKKILNTEFALPNDFNISDFVKSIIIFTAVIETIGAILFLIAFLRAGVPLDFAIWSAIFHSVSSFCTAGFGLYNNSFENYPTDYFINSIIIVLSYMGAMGFIVMTDVWRKFTGKIKELSFTSEMIILVTLSLSVIGTLIFFFTEPSIQKFSFSDKILISFFQSMSALTTVGFNTVPLGVITTASLLLITFLMYVGASPSGTGGGLKSTTLLANIAFVFSRLRGNSKVLFFKTEIPQARVTVATAVFIFYTFLIFLGTYLLSFTEKTTLTNILFEVASALGTVGLSAGITGSLSIFGKIVIIVLMFIGRLGVLTFGIAFLERSKDVIPTEIEDLAV